MNLMKYALNFIRFKSLLERYARLKNAFILVLHWVFRVVEFQSLLGPPGFDIVSSGIHKTQAHSKDFLHYYFTKKKCSCCQDWITVQY